MPYHTVARKMRLDEKRAVLIVALFLQTILHGMSAQIGLHIILLIFICQASTANRKCFSCRNIRFPSDCVFVEECKLDQECYIEELPSGNYNSGCRNATACLTTTSLPIVGKRTNQERAASRACNECCTEDYCNAYGCRLLKYECFRKINLGYFYDSTSNTCSNVVKAIGQTFSQSDASTNCQSEGADIVSIRSEAQQQFLLSWIYTHHRNTTEFWVGLKANMSGSHVYYWSDGTKPAYTYWGTSMTGQPTHRLNTDENCVFLNSKDNLSWYDGRCYVAKKGLVCEIKSVDLEADCRSKVYRGYFYDRSSYTCVRLVLSARGVNYQIAENICKQDDAKLVQIDTEEKMDFLFRWIYSNKANGSDFWIGAMDRNQSGIFTWPDGTGVNYNKWGGPEFPAPSHNQPDEVFYHKYDQRCVYLSLDHNGYWFDDKCDALKHGHICQFKGNSDKETENGCYRLLSNSYFFDYRAKICVSVVDEGVITRDTAELQCRNDNASLVEINSYMDTEFIRNLIYSLRKNGTQFWIGGKDLYKNGTFYWEHSRRPFVYTNWHQANNPAPQDCVILNRTDNYRWYPEKCSSRKQGYICEISRETIIRDSITKYMRFHTTIPTVPSSRQYTSTIPVKTTKLTPLSKTTQTKPIIPTSGSTTSSSTSSTSTVAKATTTTTTTTKTPTAVTTIPPDGYVDISNQSSSSVCIKVHTQAKIYPWAKGACEQENATLLFPTSAEMMADVRAYLKSNYKGVMSFYIGVVSYNHDSVYTSVQREPLLYSDWLSGEPTPGSNCVRTNENTDYKWQAIQCNYYLSYICQKRNGC